MRWSAEHIEIGKGSVSGDVILKLNVVDKGELTLFFSYPETQFDSVADNDGWRIPLLDEKQKEYFRFFIREGMPVSETVLTIYPGE